MKIELEIRAPFPDMLAQFSPDGVSVTYPEFQSRRDGISDVNWVKVTVEAAAVWAIPKMLDFVVKYGTKLQGRVKIGDEYERFTPEVIEKLLKQKDGHSDDHSD